MGIYRGKNFSPYTNYIIAASTTSANQVVVQPTFNAGSPINGATDLLVSNNTSGVAYVSWGLTAQTATSANIAIMPGAIMAIDMGLAATNVAVLLSAGSGNVYISIGVGT